MSIRFIIFTVLTVAWSSVDAQNTFPSSGNVGVGTTNPQFSLDVQNGNIRTSNSLYPGNLNVVSDNTSGIYWHYGEGVSTNYAIHRTAGPWSGDYYQQLRLGWITGIVLDPGSQYAKSYVDIQGGGLRITSGKLGIGTSNPDATLQIINTPQDANGNSLIIGPINGANLRMGYNTGYSWIQSHGGLPLYINQLGNNSIFNLNGGNVGIGTTSPTELLSVNGNIKSKKLIVTQTGWADYVFNDRYRLRPLAEVESFIKENKHLPEVPTSKEVEKNGVDLGETQSLLLKKIEELTLYVIELKKEITEFKKTNSK